MHENVLAAVTRHDEAEPLGCIEPFHGTSRHVVYHFRPFAPPRLLRGVDATRNALAPEASGDGNSARPVETSIARLWGQKRHGLSIAARHAAGAVTRAINMLSGAGSTQFTRMSKGGMTF
jgi:hypothetical protein